MAIVDAKGIIRYESFDSASPLHTALNIGLDSVSNALNLPGYLTSAGVHTVANLDGLNTLRTQLNNAGYGGAAYAHRTDLGELWYHSGTGSWGRYTPPAPPEDDTGWVALTLTNGWSGTSSPSVRRINGVVYFRGEVTGTNAGSSNPSFTVPVGFRPVSRVRPVIGSTASHSTILFIDTTGVSYFTDPRAATPGWMLGTIQYVANI